MNMCNILCSCNYKILSNVWLHWIWTDVFIWGIKLEAEHFVSRRRCQAQNDPNNNYSTAGGNNGDTLVAPGGFNVSVRVLSSVRRTENASMCVRESLTSSNQIIGITTSEIWPVSLQGQGHSPSNSKVATWMVRKAGNIRETFVSNNEQI